MFLRGTTDNATGVRPLCADATERVPPGVVAMGGCADATERVPPVVGVRGGRVALRRDRRSCPSRVKATNSQSPNHPIPLYTIYTFYTVKSDQFPILPIP